LEFAAQKNIRILGVFVDEGESAKFADRTQLLKLIDFCRDRKNNVQTLIVWKIDRFARNVVDHFQIKTILTKTGVTISSVTEPIDSRPEGKLMETMLAGFAQFDNDIRAIRCVGGMERKLQEGLFPWRPPLGYQSASEQKAKKTQPDVPDPERFSIIKEGWHRLLSGLYTKADIVRFFEGRQLKTRGGKFVSDKLIDKVFANKYYAGILTNPWTKEEIDGKHLPMITVGEFYQAQRMISGRGRNRLHHRLRPDFPLRGLLLCPGCGRQVTSSWARGRSKKYPYYHCYSKACQQYGRGYPKEKVESEFLTLLTRLSPRPFLIARIESRLNDLLAREREEARRHSERLRNELRSLDAEKQQLIVMRRKGIITDEEFVANHNQLSDDTARLAASIREGELTDQIGKRQISQALYFLAKAPKAIEELPIEIRKRFQHLLFPDGLVIEGFGTAKRSPIFKLIDDVQGGKFVNVDPGSKFWNRVMEQLSRIFQLIQSLQTLKGDSGHAVPKKAA
jgi:DNA invertase Pin-like site-specific DNA recombinase